jgi:hypothetical protein
MATNGISAAGGFKAQKKIAMPASVQGRMQVEILCLGFKEEFYS